jgi:hypothetical protein
MDWISALSLHNLSAGIFTTMSNVSISRPRNVKNVVGHTVLFSEMGTPNLLLIFMKVSMSILQLLLDSDPAKIKSSK